MLKNPSRGPNRSDGLRIVQSRPLSRTSAIRLGLRARVVEVRVVDDAERAQVDEAPHAGVRRGREHGRVPSVLTRRSVAPPSQSRGIGDEVEDGVGAGERRGQRVGLGDVAGADLDAARCAGREPAQDRSAPPASSRTRARTRWPASSRAGTMWLPTKPLAPVTRMVDMVAGLRVASRVSGAITASSRAGATADGRRPTRAPVRAGAAPGPTIGP